MTQWLKQAKGRTVPQEDGQPWPVDGIEIPDADETRYIRRRLADGDLIVGEAPAPDKKPAGGGGRNGGEG